MLVTYLLIRTALITSLPLIALTLGVAGVGRTFAANDDWQIIQGRAYCDLPCWAGITPLETDYQRIEALLGSAFPEADISVVDRSHEDATLASFFAYGDRPISGIITENQGRVERMGLNLYVPLWVLFQRLGKPAFVTSGPSPMTVEQLIEGPSIAIHWRQAGLHVAALLVVNPEMRLQPDTKTYFVTIEATGEDDRRVSPWRGFLPVEFYGVTTWR